jgi:hypothetical protein
LEQLVEWNLAGETEVLGENLPQRHFVHHKIPHDRPGLEPRTFWNITPYSPLKTDVSEEYVALTSQGRKISQARN